MSRRAKLAYVSDLSLQASGGGSYAVNWHACRQLQRSFDVVYAGPVKPVPGRWSNLASRIRRRVLHMPGKFAYFSPGTLNSNAVKVGALVPPGVEAIVFRSAARWCRFRPHVPYFVYLDAVFHTFFYNTFDARDFVRGDLERIWEEEARFLEGAAGVFFESQWGLDRAKEAYQLKGEHYCAVGRGGVIAPPESDSWDGHSLRLITLAMKFRQKGGDLVLEAYRRLKPEFPQLTWHIIGGSPEGDWQSLEGITYEGVISPDDPAGRRHLTDLLSNAFLLVHPTREDVNPLVPTEAAYFGCPCISVNKFALPEIVRHNDTGLLLEPPVTAEMVESAIRHLLVNPEVYREMRINSRAYALEYSGWDQIGARITSRINEVLVG